MTEKFSLTSSPTSLSLRIYRRSKHRHSLHRRFDEPRFSQQRYTRPRHPRRPEPWDGLLPAAKRVFHGAERPRRHVPG